MVARYSMILLAILMIGGWACGEEEKTVQGDLYAPCESDDWCGEGSEGQYLRCVVSPYGNSEGMCSTFCQAESDDPEESPIRPGGCYPSSDGNCWLGCCHINAAWGSGGNGLCMPFGY